MAYQPRTLCWIDRIVLGMTVTSEDMSTVILVIYMQKLMYQLQIIQHRMVVVLGGWGYKSDISVCMFFTVAFTQTHLKLE
jgi:hypothetical protein